MISPHELTEKILLIPEHKKVPEIFPATNRAEPMIDKAAILPYGDENGIATTIDPIDTPATLEHRNLSFHLNHSVDATRHAFKNAFFSISLPLISSTERPKSRIASDGSSVTQYSWF